MADPKSTLAGNWHFPTEIVFGAGRIGELFSLCHEYKMKAPLLVTDPMLAENTIVTNVLNALRKQELTVVVFSDIKSNPVGKNVKQGVTLFQEGKHDGVIAIGGGSALDVGKAIALMVGQERPIWDFEDVGENYKRVNRDGIAPCIAIPTTAGTGSEVGRASVIIDEESNTKKIIFHPDMIPNCVIADPELTVSLPPALTAATGLDALTHNLEAFLSPNYHPFADGIALRGIMLIKKWLPIAFADGSNISARANMLAASSMGATAFQKGLGAVHALAHPLGAKYDKHHGLLNAILLPYVLKANRIAIEKKMLSLARILKLEDPSFTSVLNWIVELRANLNIPHTLSEIDIPMENIDEIVSGAMLDAALETNPTKLNEEALADILQSAHKGTL